jgi:hypothetical protein
MEQISPDTIERSVHTMFTLASLSAKWLAEGNFNILLLTLKSSQPTDIVIKPPPSARVFQIAASNWLKTCADFESLMHIHKNYLTAFH